MTSLKAVAKPKKEEDKPTLKSKNNASKNNKDSSDDEDDDMCVGSDEDRHDLNDRMSVLHT